MTPLTKWINGRIALIGDAAQRVGPILGCATSVILEGVDALGHFFETRERLPQGPGTLSKYTTTPCESASKI